MVSLGLNVREIRFSQSVSVVSLLLTHDAASLDNRFPTLRDNVLDRLLIELTPLSRRKKIPCLQVFTNNVIYFVETGNNPKENIEVC
jgi:hypothetical protein